MDNDAVAIRGALTEMLSVMEQRAVGGSNPAAQNMEACELPGGMTVGSSIEASTIEVHGAFAPNHNAETQASADNSSVHPDFATQSSSLESLLTIAQRKARRLGFFLVVLRSDTAKSTAVFCCDRFGAYTSVATTRKTATKKSGCTFTLSGRADTDGQWVIFKQSGSHNHELHPSDEGDDCFKQLTQEQKQQRLALQRAGVRPKEQLSFLRQEHPELSVVVRKMYNESQSDRRRYLNGRGPIQALFGELTASGFKLEYQYGLDGSLTHLMFAHRQSADLARACHKVLLLDCTYKTNRYNMPLLICDGLTPTNNTFLCCGVFIAKEEQSDYAWALGTIKKLLCGLDDPVVLVTDNEKALLRAEELVFPTAKRVLCRWHINKNVLKKCNKYFEEEADWDEMMARWSSLCMSPTEVEYEARWSSFAAKYSPVPQLIEYVQKTWLDQKEMFMECWVSKFLHMGCTSTSRVEGLHAFLKRFLSSSVGDLLRVTQELTLAIEHQLQELSKTRSDDRVKRDFAVRSEVYNDAVYRVSRCALSMVREHVTKHPPGTRCTKHFSTTMGLPCVHVVRSCLQHNGRLNLSDFDSPWWLDLPPPAQGDPRALVGIEDLDRAYADVRSCFDACPPHKKLEIVEQLQDIARHGPSFRLKEPSVARAKGRPAGALNKRRHSTRRKPSGFEYVEGSSTLRRKCGSCRGFDHNSRTCTSTSSPR